MDRSQNHVHLPSLKLLLDAIIARPCIAAGTCLVSGLSRPRAAEVEDWHWHLQTYARERPHWPCRQPTVMPNRLGRSAESLQRERGPQCSNSMASLSWSTSEKMPLGFWQQAGIGKFLFKQPWMTSMDLCTDSKVLEPPNISQWRKLRSCFLRTISLMTRVRPPSFLPAFCVAEERQRKIGTFDPSKASTDCLSNSQGSLRNPIAKHFHELTLSPMNSARRAD